MHSSHLEVVQSWGRAAEHARLLLPIEREREAFEPHWATAADTDGATYVESRRLSPRGDSGARTGGHRITVLLSGEDQRKVAVVAYWIGGGFGILYLILAITLGVITIRRGHWVMFVLGIFLPLFWLIGALLPDLRSED